MTDKIIEEPKYGLDDEWVTSSTQFNLTAEDNIDGSGVNNTYYRVWCNGSWTAWMEYTGNFTLIGECKHYLEYYSTDNAGNVENVINQTHYVDNSPPETRISISGIKGSNKWYNSNVTIALNATDSGCGVARILYGTNGSQEDDFVMFNLTQDGIYTVNYCAEDYLGNEEGIKTVIIKIDKTKASTIHSLSPSLPNGNNGWYVSNVTITLNANDNVSGVNVTKYKIDDGNWENYSGAFIISEEGEHTIKYYSIDNAGNEEDQKEINIKIDKTKPIIHDYTLPQATTGDPLIFNASIEDANGINEAYVEYWYGNSGHTNESIETVGDYWQKEITIINTLETLHYIISAVDEAGNWNSTGERIVNITDNDNPEITSFDVHPYIQAEGGYVNISCTIIDNIYVGKVYVNITYPDLSHHSYEMEKKGNEYYYNTSFIMTGNYSCFICAMDTSNNSRNSSVATFAIVANSPPDMPTNPSPEDGQATVAVTVDLSWVCSDPDNDPLTYDIYFGISSSPPKVASNISSTTYNPSALDYSTTYYWRIVVWDEHGAKNESDLWHFTTEEYTPPNHPPTVTITYPSDGAAVNGIVTIQGKASDEDGNETIQKVEVKIDNGEWEVATGITSWSYEWNTTRVENGQHTIYARAYDGKDYSSTVSINVNVFNNHKPFIEITEPANGSIVKGSIIIKGMAWDEDGNETLQKVEIRIDEGEWRNVTGTINWNYTLDTKKLENGKYTIYARSYDGKDYSNIVSISIEVKNKKGIPSFEVIAFLAAVLAAVWARKRKKKK
ncbi:MAG: hypothetical protein FE041_05200 [Thermoplasmata archaeon]|nr:MAG: hypothetical protein FE041_05200 [Thermoplasmata archaeon]